MRKTNWVAGILIIALSPLLLAGANLPAPAIDAGAPSAPGKQTAVLAGGCFWCTEAVFEKLTGVDRVVSGYAGGEARDADYKKVSEGKTNHAESVQITFDPKKITYGKILHVFFAVAHDPTTLNRQGPDWGRQYRSVIFYRDAEQKKVAEAYIEQLTAAKAFPTPIVTEVVELKKFYAAEEYHQDFVARNPDHPYVVQHALPKLKKLSKEFPDLVRKR